MTTAVLAPAEIYAASSGLNTLALDSRNALAQPFLGEVDGSGFAGAFSATYRAIPAFSLTGSAPATSFEYTDWYFRIHVLPSLLTLGNVVSDEIFTVGVWNAWLATAQTLNSIGVSSADGTLLIGQPAPPLVYTANQQLNYTLEVATLGPPSIDAVYTFTFADAEVVTLTVIGERITAWALTPDWAQPVNEKLAWKTDRLRAWSGVQQRRALRIAPRRNVAFKTWMTKQDKQFVENQLFAWGALTWALPIWWDGQYLATPSNPGDLVVLCDTTHRDFVAGGLAIILTDARTYEVLQVTSLTATQLNLTRVVVGTWGVGSKLYPVRAARLMTALRITRDNGSLAEVEPNFQIVEPCDWTPAAGLPMYRGAPVLEDSPDNDQTAEASYERETFTIDAETGALEVYDSAQIGFPTNSHNWFLQGPAALDNFRALLYLLKGAQGEIWVPSYEEDLTLAADIAPSDSNITVDNAGFGLFAGVQNREDIRLETATGAIYYRRITGSTALTPTTELLSISSSFGVAIPASSVRRISYMCLSTLASDEIAIDHLTSIKGLALATTPFVGVNHDV